MAFQKGQGGRPKGAKNKVTVELAGAAQEYTTEALGVLVEVMRDAEAAPQARVAAVREVFDRGWGRAPQSLAAVLSGELNVATTVVHEYHSS